MQMQNKAPLVIGAILLLSSVIASTFMLDHEKESSNYAWNSYTKSVDMTQNTKMETIITKIESPYDEEGIAGTGNAGMNVSIPGLNQSSQDWLTVVDQVHKAWGAAGLKYVYNGYNTITYRGNTDNIRTDCSGYVGYCMYIYGLADSTTPISSSSDLTVFGCTEVPVSDLQPGDIVEYSGHIEVWYQDEMVVYNWGGTSSAEGKYVGVTDVSTVTSYGNSAHTRNQILKAYRVPNLNVNKSNNGIGKTVFLDAGHNCSYVKATASGPHGYAESRCKFENEFTINMRSDLKAELEANGYTVITVEDCGGTLAEYGNSGRAELFSNSNASVMIQLHSNALKNYNPSVSGGSVVYYSESKELAECVIKYYGETPVGIRGNGFDLRDKSSLAVFNHSNKPCVILEAGYGNTYGPDDNPTAYGADYDKLRDPAVRQQIAVAVRKGLDDYFTTH